MIALRGEQGIREVSRLRVERQQLSAEIARLKQERAAVERQIEELRSNPKAIEEKARRELGMIREGETVFLLPERHARAR